MNALKLDKIKGHNTIGLDIKMFVLSKFKFYKFVSFGNFQGPRHKAEMSNCFCFPSHGQRYLIFGNKTTGQ